MRLRLLALILSGVVVASSACSDAAPTSPLASPERAGFSRSSTGAEHAADGADDAPESYVFSIDPTRRNRLEFGPHSLDMPANAVCVATSTYGPDWDAPCITSKARTTIVVVVKGTSRGLPRVDFEPAIRFSPRTKVVLSLYVKKLPKDFAAFSVLYCPTTKLSCVDEALTDPTLASQYDRATRTVARRIKHFSGYLVAERY